MKFQLVEPLRELFKDEVLPEAFTNPAAKEVLRYRQALRVGFGLVRKTGLLTNNHIVGIQGVLEENNAGFRKLPGTALKDGAGRTIYTPPQDPAEIMALMTALERFINESDLYAADPLIKMALIHHQFETIHPFYDGNGRTGRILNLLHLVMHGLLDLPVLYLSRHIVRNKADYYRGLQGVREQGAWESWLLYILRAVEETAKETLTQVTGIRRLMQDTKQRLRSELPKLYSQELLNNLFRHPYTKVEFIEHDLGVSRPTAMKYLDTLYTTGFVKKTKLGRTNFYINEPLFALLGR
jgi:Fic family protein